MKEQDEQAIIEASWIEISEQDFALATEEVLISLHQQHSHAVEVIRSIENTIESVISLVQQAERAKVRGLRTTLKHNSITGQIALEINKKKQIGFSNESRD